MKIGWVVAIVIAFIFVAQAGIHIAAHSNQPVAPHFDKSTLTIDAANGAHKISVEVAKTKDQLEYGLMFRRYMADDSGMIFLFNPPQIITMWMKNTIIPLDMVFLNGSGTVTHLVENAKPESLDIISSGGPANAVIELNGGIIAKLGIKEGDKVESPDLQKSSAPPAP